MNAFTTNIEKVTLENENYRKVLYTGKLQLVVMSLKAGEDIPLEVHNEIDQFIRIEKGSAYVKVGHDEFNLKLHAQQYKQNYQYYHNNFYN